MNRPTDDLGEGVLFARDDCAGLAVRFMILLVDFMTLLFGVTLIAIAFYSEHGDEGESSFAAFWLSVALTFTYLVVIESTIGTVGFAFARVRIVNLKGTRPSILRMTFRLLLWALGPIHPLVDFFWISNDRQRQTLRDKLAGTYVVKKGAVPIEDGRIRAVHYFLMGFSILFPEVHVTGGITSDSK